jgi:hypothetical protein
MPTASLKYYYASHYYPGKDRANLRRSSRDWGRCCVEYYLLLRHLRGLYLLQKHYDAEEGKARLPGGQ